MKKFTSIKENVTEEPIYDEGKIYLIAQEEVPEETIGYLCYINDCKLLGLLEDSSDVYIIQTPKGKEKQTGEFFTKRYPDIIASYDFIDIRENITKQKIDEIVDDLDQFKVETIESTLNKKKLNKETYNRKLETIIEKIKELQIK